MTIKSMAVTARSKIDITSHLIRGVLSVKPLANFAKSRARNMMINRAEAIGVPWRDNVRQLSDRNWERELTQVENSYLEYPSYYTTSFHAYEEGNLSWKAAWEVESASRAVHAKIWSSGDVRGDAMLRQSYHQALKKTVTNPDAILDLGCGIGMSTQALQANYPQAQITGIDLSPYFLAVAQYRAEQRKLKIKWIHGAAESTGLSDRRFDLASASLMFHELPTTAAYEIIAEARRLLHPGGYLSIMDMNPGSEVFQKMPPYVLTLLKSTEPYLDLYFSLDLEKMLVQTGFATPIVSFNSPRHKTIVARAI